jgi:hypothetical protein
MALSLSSRRSREYDEGGNGPYDPKFPGGKVVADCGRVRGRLMLTDVGLPVNGLAGSPRRLPDGPLKAGLCAATADLDGEGALFLADATRERRPPPARAIMGLGPIKRGLRVDPGLIKAIWPSDGDSPGTPPLSASRD